MFIVYWYKDTLCLCQSFIRRVYSQPRPTSYSIASNLPSCRRIISAQHRRVTCTRYLSNSEEFADGFCWTYVLLVLIIYTQSERTVNFLNRQISLHSFLQILWHNYNAFSISQTAKQESPCPKTVRSIFAAIRHCTFDDLLMRTTSDTTVRNFHDWWKDYSLNVSVVSLFYDAGFNRRSFLLHYITLYIIWLCTLIKILYYCVTQRKFLLDT